MSLDNLLTTLADLVPKNVPEIEVLPITNFKVGDEVLIIWVAEKEVWTVLALCSDGYVDIRCKTSKAAMSIPLEQLRLASLLLNKFKKGDLIVVMDGLYQEIFTITKESNDGFVIEHESDAFGVQAYSIEYPYSDIRHATPEEIKAGKRLP
ncbi:hypothetical protein P256_00043 [Acinetobacter nectaris CIP 110549]|uniref:Uncharacterized protein n=1 Tax=Acinetobacter nectaris CIP 110549 TaxID=1392540 RepID=V2TG90_9GAMM|nr:hypothetical protein [Acinetobacter nectaris]ESK40279.1 hypothetical protein P256_00726 [Acinetobacter nectaris CIP 110549]ESK41058.1 hypothetical protein P256_00043 [Acinetobacter nectaris CIP 110549]